MKTKNILLAATLLYSLFVTAQAQNDKWGSFDGIQSTFNNVFNSDPFEKEARKALRLFMLRTNDISMFMKVDIALKRNELGNGFYYTVKEKKNSMYAEFDWDNLAQSMHVITSAHREGILKENVGIPFTTDKGTNHYQYTDKEGYWYTPFDDPNNPGLYVKTNAKQAAINQLNELLDISDFLNYEILMNRIKKLTTGLLYHHKIHLGEPNFIEIFLHQMEKHIVGATSSQSQQKMKEAIEALMNERYSEIVGFPVFIHWALIYSPDIIKGKYNVVEAKVSCNNLPNECTKLTVASGKEKGKFMVFDQYDRLILINSKKEGTVKYNYDRDLSVILPPAMTFAETVFYNRKQNAGDKRKKEMDETIKEAKEKAKKKGGKDEKQKEKEKERLRNEELAKLEEQLKEAVTPQEREEIQQKIKELKELIENNN